MSEIEQEMRSWLDLSPDDERPIGELAELMVKQARRHGGGGLLDKWFQKMADALQEASRTQSPAELRVAAKAAFWARGPLPYAGLDEYDIRLAAALRAASMTPPVSERYKEETVEVLFQAVSPFIDGTAWREVRAALSAALETPPLHKEGEDDEALYAWLYPYVCDDGQTRILISEMRKRFAVPVPVTKND